MDSEDRILDFLTGLACGAALGAGLALLLAPSSGKKTRKRLSQAAEDLRESAGEHWEEIAEEVRAKMDDALALARKRVP